MKMKNVIPLTLLAIVLVAIVGVQMQFAPRAYAATELAGALTAKAGAGGVTSGTFVKLSSAGVVVAATAVTDSVVGVCELTASADAQTRYAPMGTRTTVTSGEAIAVGDLLTAGTSGKAYVLDTDDASTQRIAGQALTAASGADEDVTVILVASVAEQRLALPSLAVGGGYGSTGVSISDAGVLEANGAITSDGAVTGGSLTDGTITIMAGSVTGTWVDLGAITTADLNGGSIDGVTIGAAAAPTVTDLGSVATCDINGGTVDGVTIGGATPAAVTGTTVTGTTITDGTATLTGGDLSGVGTATVTTLTDGTVTITGGAATGTLDISGATVTYRAIANADVAAGAAIVRSKLATEDLVAYAVPFTALRNASALALVAAAEDNEFGITSAGFGTGTLTIDGDPASGESETQTLMFEFSMPAEYVASGDVTLAVEARESVGAATVSTTISAEVYECDSQGGVSADLYNAFDATDVTTSWATHTAVVTDADLVAGDKLRVFVRIVTNDTGAAVGTVAQIGRISIKADVRG